MIKTLTVITTTGLFCALASYSYGRVAPVPQRNAAKSGPVTLWRASDLRRQECGEDWLCLLAWANETKSRRR